MNDATHAATGRIRGKEPNHTMAWLRGVRPSTRRRKLTPRRMDLLTALALEPWLTFKDISERAGVDDTAIWQAAQRCVRDGLLQEHRRTIDGRPSRCARYGLTEAGFRIAEQILAKR